MKKVIVFLADGFEEVEALTQVDLLRRAGAEVLMVSINENLIVKGARNIEVKADCLISDLQEELADLYILPGGMPGTTNLDNCELVKNIIKRAYNSEKSVAAICAAPSVFGHIGILENRLACCYPGFEDELIGAKVVYEEVAVDENVITSRGVGTAIDLALKLVEILYGSDKSNELGKSIVYEKN